MPHRPFWFEDNKVLIINAPTCGINKDGHEQYIVDPDTGNYFDEIDDKLWQDVASIFKNKNVSETNYTSNIERFLIVDFDGIVVPQYYDNSTIDDINDEFSGNEEFELRTIGDLVSDKVLMVIVGHGSPSQDQRVGEIPYIKVSDLRSGNLNINPTNMIPLSLAEKFWKGKTSKIRVYDVVSPVRASKNIGEFCMILKGQDQIVLTKEVVVLRCAQDAIVDQFYISWALSLTSVRKQWNRIVFMQTNREDVGSRYREIIIPMAKNKEIADKYSKAFKKYYTSIEKIRDDFRSDLQTDEFSHEIYL